MGLCSMSICYPGGIIKNLVAIVMAGVLAIYGLIVAIIISNAVVAPRYTDDGSGGSRNTYSQYNGWAHLAAGLCCGLTCLAAGGATGIAGEVGIISTGLRAQVNHAKSISLRGNPTTTSASSPNGSCGLASLREVVNEGDAGKLYIGVVTILSFSGAIGLYGFIIALIITSSTDYRCE